MEPVDQNFIEDPVDHVEYAENGPVKGRREGWLDRPVFPCYNGWAGWKF